MAETTDGGDTWSEINNKDKRLRTDSGEAFFAASGSNIRLFRSKEFVLVSGGTLSRLFSNDEIHPLPLLQGKESTGANSIDVFDDGIPDRLGKRLIVVGGDFSNAASTEKNCFISTNGGKTWKAPKTPPNGYRSSVEFLSKNDVLTCGLNGIDYSRDGGKNWRLLSKESFNVCKIARIGTGIFLAGANGRIGRISFD